MLWLFVITVTLFLFKSITSAHELSSEGTVSALLHIEPNDDPVALIPQQFELTFTDSGNRLDLYACDCAVNLSNDNQKINLLLNPTSNLTSLNNYTFKEAGKYQLTVLGKPKIAGLFQSFSLKFDVSVKKQTKKSRVLLVAGIVAIQAIIALGIYKLLRNNK